MDKNGSARWLIQAKDDLAWTEANIREKIWYGACFTAQQTAEKSLKAYLASKGEKIRKIHDLVALLEECAALDKGFDQLREICAVLTDYYVPVRYPDVGDLGGLTEKEAGEALELAERIVKFVEEKLK